MTRVLVAGAACAVVTLAAPAEAEAAPCGSSAATVAADVWSKWDRVALAAGCAVASAFGVDYNSCYTATTTYSGLLQTMINWWSSMVTSSWASIGPRDIIVGDPAESGTLILGGTRVFCTPAPVAEETVKVRLTKDGGKAKTKVEICTMERDGTSSEEFEYTFARGSDNIGVTEARTVNGARDKVLCIKLDNRSAARKFSYKLSAVKG